MDMQLKDKVAIITGSSRGIGKRTARQFVEEGCAVGICGRDAASLEATAAELTAMGGSVYAAQLDITDAAACEAFVSNTAEALGGIDILINNVGGTAAPFTDFADTTDDDWVKTYELNIFHGMRMTRLVLPYMQERGGGSVVIVASISGWKPNGSPLYGTAKAAEIFAAPELAINLAGDNIRVNAVSPGSIIWPDNSWDTFSRDEPEVFERFVGMGHPAKHLGDPERVADTIVFVASPRGDWINGANVPVDGGQQWSSISPIDLAELQARNKEGQ